MSKWGKISYLVAGISAVILLATRYFLGGWIDLLWIPLVLTGVGIVASLVIDYKFYLEFLAMRTTKHGMNMGTLILGALVLAVAANYASLRFDKTIDFTEEGLNSLSDQSLKVLDSLPDTVLIRVFYRGQDDLQGKQEIQQKLQVYLDNTSKIQVEYINSFVDADLAKEYLKAGDDLTVQAELGGRRINIKDPYLEEQVTSALIKVQRTEPKKIYFLAGHGEKDIDSDGRDGLSEVKSALEGSNFTVAKLNLLTGDKLPEDGTGVLAIVGPKTPLLENELEAIRGFAKKGGALLLAVDPGERHQAALLTKSFGVEFKNNYVINDRVRIYGIGRAAVLGTEFDRESQITKSFTTSENYALFYLASEVARAPDYTGSLSHRDVVSTDPGAFALNNLSGAVPPNPERDRRVLAIGVEGSMDGGAQTEVDSGESDEKKPNSDAGKFRGVFVGDSEFMTNQILFQGVNRDLLLNSIAYLSDDVGLISIRPKKPKGTQLTMTTTSQKIAVAAGVGFPLLLFVVGAVVWFRRRGL